MTARRRVYLVLAVPLLMISALAEMSGMIAIFGYIGGLTAESHGRSGILLRVVETLFGPMSQLEFAVYGGAIVLAVFVAKNLLAAVIEFVLGRVIMQTYIRTARKAFLACLSMPYEAFKAPDPAYSKQDLTQLYRLFNVTVWSAIQALADSILVLLVAALLVFIAPYLTLSAVVLFAVPALAWSAVLRQRLPRIEGRDRGLQKKAKTLLDDAFGGFVDVRLSSAEDRYLSHYGNLAREMTAIGQRRRLIARIPGTLNEFALAIGIVLAVLYYTLSDSLLTNALPVLALFGFAGLRLSGVLTRISNRLTIVRQSEAGFQRFCAVLDALESIPDGAPTVSSPGQDAERVQFAGRREASALHQPLLEARGVSWCRATADADPVVDANAGAVNLTTDNKTPQVIRDLSLVINQGEFISLLSASGQETSTLMLLLMGLREPRSGAILWRGEDIQTRLRDWQSRVGYIAKQPFVARASLRENVAFGIASERIDDTQVESALDRAGFVVDPEVMPQGLWTLIGRGGARLSAVKRQQIALARAFYRDCEVVCFEEIRATDDSVARPVAELARLLAPEKTVICVPRRLTTLRESDRILLLVEGSVIATGTFDELIDSSSVFNELLESGYDGSSPSRNNAVNQRLPETQMRP